MTEKKKSGPKMRPCPLIGHKPCPGTRLGCVAWGSWLGKDTYEDPKGFVIRRSVMVSGCKYFGIEVDDLRLNPPKERKK